MLKKHSQLFEGLFTASDLLVVSLAWVLSYWLRFASELIPVDKGIPPFMDYLRMLLFVWLIWGFVFRRFGLYRPMRGVSRVSEAWAVIRANTFAVVLLLAITYLFREKSVPFSRLVFVIFWALSTVLTVLSRSLIRQFLRALRRRGYNLRYALIVGTGELASKVARRMMAHPEYGIILVGCLAGDRAALPLDRPVGRRWRTMGLWREYDSMLQIPSQNGTEPESAYQTALPIVGRYEDLPKFLEQGNIDQVIVSLPLTDHHRLEEVISLIGDAMVDVKIVPDVHQFIQLGSQVEEFDGLPVVSLASTPLAGVNRVLKRGFDIVLGTAIFVLVLPLMLLLAVLVKCTSRGPIFFSQERVGLDGRRFQIYKFRTMTVDAEVNGAKFAVRNDPRVTPLGRILRRLSLDELPQLANVIQGHMSLVGPRPERPVFIDEFRARIPRYMLRHKVQAGMTGWAQVNGWRGNTSIEKRIEHDLFYIENWSLVLDMKIIGLTLLRGIRDRNAY
ncbi:MAG: undecaprenyl-phosphate glucose phosphotransferase [Bdellovibrionales bacterium]|nr:undecaprenyl-phosphate glucose phosphotransferase [Bdellovibrionales bacterium]